MDHFQGVIIYICRIKSKINEITDLSDFQNQYIFPTCLFKGQSKKIQFIVLKM